MNPKGDLQSRNERFRLLACLVVAVALSACGTKPSPSSSAPMERANVPDSQRKLQRSTNLMMDAINKPTMPIHFSYKGQQNLNDKYPREESAKPEVGPIQIEADISPDALNLTETRGGKKTERKIAKSDAAGMAFARLDLLGPLMNVTMVTAVGTPVAQPAGSDAVEGAAADKFQFDTATATGPKAAGVQMAKSMLTNFQNVKGTVWVDQSSGRLSKFNLDADFADKAGNTWKEHYEGEVTPK